MISLYGEFLVHGYHEQQESASFKIGTLGAKMSEAK